MKKKKPTPKKVEKLDYTECVEFINGKLGYDIDNVKGSEEFRCFWHYLGDNLEIHNGCEITLDWLEPEEGEEWVQEILNAFHEEFGAEAIYDVWW